MSSSSSIDLGIYFGGSSMVIAYSRDDKVSVIVNESGDRSTPTALAITGAEYSVGLPAKQNLIRNAHNTILYSKHFIEQNLQRIDKYFIDKLQVEVKDLSESEIAFLVEKNSKSYELSLSECIEKELKYLNGAYELNS